MTFRKKRRWHGPEEKNREPSGLLGGEHSLKEGELFLKSLGL